jgi:hypothetical protein
MDAPKLSGTDLPKDVCDQIPPPLLERSRKLLSRELVRLKSDRDVRDSLGAIKRLRRDASKDGPSDELILFYAACAVVKPHRPRPGARRKDWSEGTGKTWKALQEFPARLLRMAEEMEQVNRGHWFNSKKLTARGNSGDEGTSKTWKALLELSNGGDSGDDMAQFLARSPYTLKAYAAHIKMRIWTALLVEIEVKMKVPIVKQGGFRQEMFQLSDLVKDLTGKYHDNEVEGLLNAVADACGRKDAFSFDALSIAQARFRRKKR